MTAVISIDAWRAGLRPEHVEHLQTSGLSEATIAAARIGSVGPEDAERLGYAKKLAGIIFPYAGTEIVVNGETLAYTRLRVDSSRQRSPGRKYENPLKRRIQQGYTYYPYVPEQITALRKDATQPVFVTEGEKKALKLVQEGFPAIGIPGVYMFTDPSSRKPAHSKPLHPDLSRWRWRGRTVYVCFDSDRTEKDGVGLAHERLCSALTQQGAVVKVVVLPRLDGMDKTGADDFLVVESAGAFAELVQQAGPWEPFAWVVDLIPDGVPEASLRTALLPLHQQLTKATSQEIHAVAGHLRRRYPSLSEGQALAILLPQTEGRDSDLPQVVVNGCQIREVVGEAWHALEISPMGKRLFLLDEALVFAAKQPSRSARQIAMQAVDPPLMTALLNRSATWMSFWDASFHHTRVPAEVVRDMIAMPHRSVRVLDAVVHLPVLHRDGTVTAASGYEPTSRLFQAVDPAVSEAVEAAPVVPSTADRVAALDLLRQDLLGDFPFARSSDRAHVLAAVLLPAVRHWIDGPIPLHLFEAPTEGTGKTLLADVLTLLATGSPAMPTPLPRSEEEVRKKITATLLSAPQIVLLDNLGHALDSPSIAAVLTSEVWTDRILGHSRMVRVPNRALWIATANNPVLSREVTRRTVRVRLDADVECPWLREDFRHADLRGWARFNRPQLAAAVATLARGWLADGSPSCSEHLGSFESWSHVIGGILASAGVEGFLEDRYEAIEQADPEEAEWRGLIELWSEQHGTDPVSGGDLLALAAEENLFHLDPQSANTPRERARFSRALNKRRDRIYGAWRITVGRDAKRKQNLYYLSK